MVLFCFHRQSGLSQGAACQAKRGSVETASWASGFDYERRAVPESAPALVPGILQEGPPLAVAWPPDGRHAPNRSPSVSTLLSLRAAVSSCSSPQLSSAWPIWMPPSRPPASRPRRSLSVGGVSKWGVSECWVVLSELATDLYTPFCSWLCFCTVRAWPLRLTFTEYCDECSFPIDILIYRFCSDISVVSRFIKFPILWHMWLEPHSRPYPHPHSATTTASPRPYQPPASALHPTSTTASTVSDLGKLGSIPSPRHQ